MMNSMLHSIRIILRNANLFMVVLRRDNMDNIYNFKKEISNKINNNIVV